MKKRKMVAIDTKSLVVVTGVNGHLASILAELLLEKGFKVVW